MLVSTSSKMLRGVMSSGFRAMAPLGQALGPRVHSFREVSVRHSVVQPLSRQSWTGKQRIVAEIPDSLKPMSQRNLTSSSFSPGSIACHGWTGAAKNLTAAMGPLLQHRPAPQGLQIGRLLAQGAAGYCFLKAARLPVAMAQGSSKTVWSFIPGAHEPESSPEHAMEADSLTKNVEDALASVLRWLQRLWIPLCTAVVLYLAEMDIVAGAISLVGIMLATCPSVESLYAWMAEKRRRPNSTIADIVDDVAVQVLGLAQLEYHDCYLFAVARIRRRLLLGIFGHWWEMDSVWPFSLLDP